MFFAGPFIHSKKEEYFCLKCLENVDYIIKLECGCFCCEECLSKWALTFIEKNFTCNTQNIPCPMNYCPKSFEISYILSVFNSVNREKVSWELTSKYFSQTKDITKCPNRKCNYAGIRSIEPCEIPYECSNCSYRWRENGLFHINQSLNYFYFLFRYFIIEYYTLIIKFLIGVTCPKCSFYFTLNNRYIALVCPSCKYGFCRICFVSYKRKFGHTGKDLCGFRIIFWMIFIALMIFWIHFICSEIFSFCSMIDQLFVKLFKRIFLLIIFLLSFIPLICSIDIYSDLQTNKKKYIQFIAFLLSLIIFSSLIILVIYLYYYLDFLLELLFTIAYIILLWNSFFSSFALAMDIEDMLKCKFRLKKSDFVCLIVYWVIVNLLLVVLFHIS